MSFKQNDNNDNHIHLGNYEEFFVLYMDNELTAEQVKMVDDFLVTHPDLQAEFEILMSTKLPSEPFSINKADLFADSMKMNTVGEELLLYIDNELPSDQARVVELEMDANKEYRFQHELLLKTKLDAAEAIPYPNKKELYRREERRIGFQPWMRIAAAAIIIAAMGVIYFNNNPASTGNDVTPDNGVAIQPPTGKGKGADNSTAAPATDQTTGRPDTAPAEQNNVAVNEERKGTVQKKNNEAPADDVMDNEVVLIADVPLERVEVPEEIKVKTATPVDGLTSRTIDIGANAHYDVNNSVVTSPSIPTYNNTETPDKGDLASNEKKGSVKGFLRKATRMIEKRTGIDATNDDGRLLIGAVALKLK